MQNDFNNHDNDKRDYFEDDFEYTYTEHKDNNDRYVDYYEDWGNIRPNKGGMDKGIKTFLISSVVILIILLAILVGYFIYAVNNSGGNGSIQLPGISESGSNSSNDSTQEENPNAPKINIESQPSDGTVSTAEEVYTKAAPSVVGVVVYAPNSSIVSEPLAQGSGIIVTEDGYIVTNAHVVQNSKQYNIKIVLNTEEEFSGKVIGYDTRTDLAVIKAEKTGLTPASFGDSDAIKIGAPAYTLGNPGGLNFASSLTSGIISAVNRSVGTAYLAKYIQTDAPINEGNSGGALLNKYGQVIGVNTVKLTGTYEGMGFAVPSNTVKTVVDDIIAKGYVSGRAKLGVSGKMVSSFRSQIYGVPVGIIISEISQESDLLAKGVKTDDIITKINDITVTGFDMFYKEIANHKPGDTVKLTIYRLSSNRENSSTFDVNVKLLEDKGEVQQQSISGNK